MRTRQLVVVLLCLVGCAVAPAPASAKLTAEVAIQPDGAAQRILATLRSDRPLSARKRPTSLQLKLKGKLVVLAARRARHRRAPWARTAAASSPARGRAPRRR